MEYRVVPFSADVSSHQGGSDAASNLQSLINSETSGDWEFVDFEQVQSYKAGSSGCFGTDIGATEPETFTVTMVIFRR